MDRNQNNKLIGKQTIDSPEFLFRDNVAEASSISQPINFLWLDYMPISTISNLCNDRPSGH